MPGEKEEELPPDQKTPLIQSIKDMVHVQSSPDFFGGIGVGMVLKDPLTFGPVRDGGVLGHQNSSEAGIQPSP